jgi:hypothetical protein
MPTKAHAVPLRTERSVRADLENLEEFNARYEFLDNEEDRLDKELAQARASLEEVRRNDLPEKERLEKLSGEPGTKRLRSLAVLQSKVGAAEGNVKYLEEELSSVQKEKRSLEGYHTGYESRRKRLEDELEETKAKKPEPPVAAASVAAPAAQAASAAPPKVERPAEEVSESEKRFVLRTKRGELAPNGRYGLGYPENVEHRLTPQEVDEIYEDRRYYREPVASRPASQEVHRATYFERVREWGSDNGPLTFVIALVLIAIILWIMFANGILPRFWEQAATPTSRPVATAAVPSASAPAAAVADSPVRTLLIDMPRIGAVINMDELPMVVVDRGTGKATYNAKAQVVDTSGRPVSGARVTVQGKTYTTDSNGWAYFPLEFTSSNPVSEKNTVRIEVDGKAKVYEIWAARILDNAVGAPALDRQTVASVNATDPRFRAGLQQAGVTPENLVGIDVGVSDGQTPMIQMDQNGNVSSGGFVPAGQPVWVLSYRMADGTIKKVFINPVCVNVFVPPSKAATPAPAPGRGSILVVKFHDVNGNGQWDGNEPGISGVTISLSSGQTATTNGEGKFFFSNLATGNVTVSEVVPSGWFATTATSVTVTVHSGQTTQVNFGNRRVVSVTQTPKPRTPTPVPSTPAPTPTPTKIPSNNPTAPPPPPPSVTPPPTQTPLPPVGTITVTRSESCGTGCWRIDWTSPNTFGGHVVYGRTGYLRDNRVDGTVIGVDTYTVTLTHLDSTYGTFQAVAYPRDGSAWRRTDPITFPAR